MWCIYFDDLQPLHKKKNFSINDFFSKWWPNPQFLADWVTFIEDILKGNLHFLCSEHHGLLNYTHRKLENYAKKCAGHYFNVTALFFQSRFRAHFFRIFFKIYLFIPLHATDLFWYRPENIGKLEVFWCFQGVSKEISGMKWVKGSTSKNFSISKI